MLTQCCRMLVAATLFLPAVYAQTELSKDGEASLTGTVRDPSGAAIVGAHVVLKQPDGHVRDTQTGREGTYRFAELGAGRYVLNVESKGFEAKSQEVNANGQETLTLNFVLPVKTQRQSMTVTDRLDRQTDYSPAVTNSTAMKTDTPVLLTPQSVQTVPTAVLLEQNAVLLSDATRNVAGVAQDFGFNGGTQPSLILRGFPANFSWLQEAGAGDRHGDLLS